jgi:hypothetical protein
MYLGIARSSGFADVELANLASPAQILAPDYTINRVGH